jgi:putative transposase
MRQLGIKGTHRRRYRKTTERDASLPVAPDLVNRDFTASRPDEKYVGDITYIRTWEGWLYLAIILDVFSRRIVGWSMGVSLHTRLVVEAFEMAVRRRQAKGAIAHSDQGSQYGRLTYGRRIREAGLVSPWAAVGIASTTRWPSPSSPAWSASSSTARSSEPAARPGSRSSTTSRASTTLSAATRA